MKNLIFKFFIGILMLFFVLVSKIYSQVDCPGGQVWLTFTAYASNCSTVMPNQPVLFWTTDEGGESFSLITDNNGQIAHCFDKIYDIWYMTPTGLDCDAVCTQYFEPFNITGRNIKIAYWCNVGSPCNCDEPKSSNLLNNNNNIPISYELFQNYPNPFNPQTSIKFILPKDDYVKLSVFDLSGKELLVLLNENMNAGLHSAEFDGTNFASGIYIYRIETEYFTQTMKMVLIK